MLTGLSHRRISLVAPNRRVGYPLVRAQGLSANTGPNITFDEHFSANGGIGLARPGHRASKAAVIGPESVSASWPWLRVDNAQDICRPVVRFRASKQDAITLTVEHEA